MAPRQNKIISYSIISMSFALLLLFTPSHAFAGLHPLGGLRDLIIFGLILFIVVTFILIALIFILSAGNVRNKFARAILYFFVVLFTFIFLPLFYYFLASLLDNFLRELLPKLHIGDSYAEVVEVVLFLVIISLIFFRVRKSLVRK